MDNKEILEEINDILTNKKSSRDVECLKRTIAYEKEYEIRRDKIHKKYDALIKELDVSQIELKKKYQNLKSIEVRQLGKDIVEEFGYIGTPSFKIKIIKKEYIYIEDLDNGWVTVTNDPEGVLFNLRGIIKGRKLFYKDTDGNIDEILQDDQGYFAGFKIGARNNLNG